MKMLIVNRLAGTCLVGAILFSGCETAQPRPVAAKPRLPTTVTLSQAPRPPVVTAKAEVPSEPASLAITNPVTELPPTGIEGTDPTASVRPPSPARRSFVDITARSCFGHADDYTWLSGELQYSHLSKAWRLRFASVDEADPWGGSVTLVCDRPAAELKDGVCVRVRGHIDEGAGKNSAPPYQVDSIQVIENPDQAKGH